MRNAMVSARVEPRIKAEAETILSDLGVSVSTVINSLYRQIIYQNGIPFSICKPRELKTLDSFSEQELEAKLEHSYIQARNGYGKPVDEVFDNLQKDVK